VNSDYVFLCGVMWCRYGQPDAGEELLRASASPDTDLRAMALAMLARGRKALQQYPNLSNFASRGESPAGFCLPETLEGSVVEPH
jgi:hypothetical protein